MKLPRKDDEIPDGSGFDHPLQRHRQLAAQREMDRARDEIPELPVAGHHQAAQLNTYLRTAIADVESG